MKFKILLFLFFFASIGFTINRVSFDLRELIVLNEDVKWEYIYICAFLFISSLLIKSFRAFILLQPVYNNLKYKKFLIIYTRSSFYGMITFGKLGDISRIYMLNQIYKNKTLNVFSYTLERLIDLFVALGFVLSIYILSDDLSIYLFIIFIFIFISILFKFPDLLLWIIKKFFAFSFVTKLGFTNIDDLDNPNMAVPYTQRIYFFLLTSIVFFSNFVQIFLLFSAFSIKENFLSAVYLSLLISLSSIFSLTPNAIGFREVVVLNFATSFNASAYSLLFISLLDGTIIPLIILGMIFLFSAKQFDRKLY